VNGRRAFLGSRAAWAGPNWPLTCGFRRIWVSHPSARSESVTDARTGTTSGATAPADAATDDVAVTGYDEVFW